MHNLSLNDEHSLSGPENRFEWATGLFLGRYGLIVGVARRYAPLSQCVEDIVHDTYLTFMQGAMEGRWDLNRDVGALLCQIAKRKAQQTWEKQKKKNHISINAIAELLIPETDEGPEPESLKRFSAELLALNHCLGKLPSRNRALIELHYYEDAPVKEIAERYGKSGTAIFQLFARIRVKLRECIRRTLEEDERKNDD